MRTPDIPGWALAVGIVGVAAVVLGFASLGGVLGVLLFVVVLLGVVVLLHTWATAELPAPDPVGAEPQAAQPDDSA